MKFITLAEAKKLSFIPVETRDVDHPKFGKLTEVRVYIQDWDDWGNLDVQSEYYYLLK